MFPPHRDSAWGRSWPLSGLVLLMLLLLLLLLLPLLLLLLKLMTRHPSPLSSLAADTRHGSPWSCGRCSLPPSLSLSSSLPDPLTPLGSHPTLFRREIYYVLYGFSPLLDGTSGATGWS